MKIKKEKITVLFGSWIHLNKDSKLYDKLSDIIDVNFEDIDYVDDIFRGLQPADRLQVFCEYLESICKDNKCKVIMTSIPDLVDVIKGFCDYNKILYKFVFFKVSKNEKSLINYYDLELEDLGVSDSKIFKEANKEWQEASKIFYPGDESENE